MKLIKRFSLKKLWNHAAPKLRTPLRQIPKNEATSIISPGQKAVAVASAAQALQIVSEAKKSLGEFIIARTGRNGPRDPNETLVTDVLADLCARTCGLARIRGALALRSPRWCRFGKAAWSLMCMMQRAKSMRSIEVFRMAHCAANSASFGQQSTLRRKATG